MEKQVAGFKFGKHPTKLIRECGQLPYDGRTYKLALVEADGLPYYSIRLYNNRGKFIKQLMFEPSIISEMSSLLAKESIYVTMAKLREPS